MSNQAIEDFLNSQYGSVDLTMYDMIVLAAAFLDSIGNTVTRGWASPASSLDYWRSDGDFPTEVVRDFIAWTSGRRELAPNADVRMREWIDEIRWRRHQVGRFAESLGVSERSAA